MTLHGSLALRHGPPARRPVPRPRPLTPWALAHARPVLLPEGGCALHVPPSQPGRPTVLLLHGWAMNRSAWVEAAHPLLARGYGLVLPDLPGHGEARALPADVPAERLFDAAARRVLLALDALGLERVPVAGYSMGATVALALLRHAPERFERALLLGPLVGPPARQLARAPRPLLRRLGGNVLRALRGPQGPVLRRAALGLLAHALPLPAGWQRRVAARLADGERLPARSTFHAYLGLAGRCETEVFLEGLARTDFRTTARYLSAAARSGPLHDAFERFRGPVVLATGALDALAPHGFCSRYAPPRTPLVRIADADHVALSQAPREVTALLVSWLCHPTPSLEVNA